MSVTHRLMGTRPGDMIEVEGHEFTVDADGLIRTDDLPKRDELYIGIIMRGGQAAGQVKIPQLPDLRAEPDPMADLLKEMADMRAELAALKAGKGEVAPEPAPPERDSFIERERIGEESDKAVLDRLAAEAARLNNHLMMGTASSEHRERLSELQRWNIGAG